MFSFDVMRTPATNHQTTQSTPQSVCHGRIFIRSEMNMDLM
jgi:hypothetical protein